MSRNSSSPYRNLWIQEVFKEESNVTSAVSRVLDELQQRRGYLSSGIVFFGKKGNLAFSNSQSLKQVLGNPKSFAVHRGHVLFQGRRLSLPLFALHTRGMREHAALRKILLQLEIRSCAFIGIYVRNRLKGLLVVGLNGKSSPWDATERRLLQGIADTIAEQLVSVASRPEQGAIVPANNHKAVMKAPKVREQISLSETSTRSFKERDFERLLEYGQLILLKIATNLRITEVCGNSQKFFGVSEEKIVERDDIWEKLFDPVDLRRMALRIRRMGKRAQEFGEEIRYRPYGEDMWRWLLVKATPVFAENVCVGWEAFVIDISERRLVESELRMQRQRIEALYEVSRALRVNVDPALVALKGLNALIRVTSSSGGLCCFYDQDTQSLEMVAAEGLSQEYIDGLSKIFDGPNLLRHAIEENRGLRIENIQRDSRAAQDLARREGVKGSIIMPLSSGPRILGALVVFSPTQNKYSEADFQVVAAAASQISFAARQAEFYTAEKKETEAVSALYRLTHELSKLSRGQEIGEHLFHNIQQQVACKRAWFGIMNNQGTHIVGQAGMGPSVRQSVKDIQIELGLRHDFFDEAISSKQPVIIAKGSEMECSGLNRFFQKITVGTLVILPLVSLEQVVGVLVLEPVIGSEDYIQKKLPLLVRMTDQVATILMARHFEERVAESDKMRVANMLASGVAHNFNNLLQTVMGHASLIQMQSEEKSSVQDIATAIIDSAGKGAALVRQLLELASGAVSPRERVSLSQMIENSRDLFTSMLGGAIELLIHVDEMNLEIDGDVSSLQQVISNLLANAKEAIEAEAQEGVVELSLRRVRVSSGEVDPSLSPGEYVRLDIKDNGQGMNEERLARCFEPFYSSKSLDESTGLSLSGAGLGLSSAYSIVQQHGGMISVASVVGEGTTFSLFFPLLESVNTVENDTVLAAHTPQRVLLLLPGGSPALAVQNMFETFGVDSYVMHDMDGMQTLAEDERLKEIKLVVIDADYLGKSTLSIIDTLRQAEKNLSFVVMTVSRNHWYDALREDSATTVVEKPLSIRAIQRVMKNVFDSSYSSQSDERKKLTRQVEKKFSQKTEDNQKISEFGQQQATQQDHVKEGFRTKVH